MKNIWKRFERLRPDAEIRVGTVMAHDGDTGESVLEDAGGAEFRAVGTSVGVGSNAYVKDGVVTGWAPALTNVGILYV